MVPRRPLRSLVEALQLDLAILRRNPEAAAGCLARRIPPASTASGRPRVLYLAKPIFNEDVAALARFGRRFDYAPLPSTDLRRIYYRFVSAPYHHNHTSYYRDGNEAERRDYFRFVRGVLAALQDAHRPAAILSSNHNYCWQQEVARACEELGLPFIVLHKEGISLSGDHDEEVARYTNGRFAGDALLAYNHGVARALANAGIARLTPERIAVVGVPRLDAYVRDPPAEGRDVAFFSFDLAANLGHLERFRRHAPAIERRTRHFHQLALHFAERHPDVRVIVKFKRAATHRKLRDCMLTDYGRRPPSNVVIMTDGDTEAIIRNARAVASCHSTTLLEGLLARRAVVTPSYDDVIEGGLADCFAAHPRLVRRVTTLEQFEEAVLGTGGAPSGADHPLFDALMYRADGAATERIEDAIASTIASTIGHAVEP